MEQLVAFLIIGSIGAYWYLRWTAGMAIIMDKVAPCVFIVSLLGLVGYIVAGLMGIEMILGAAASNFVYAVILYQFDREKKGGMNV